MFELRLPTQIGPSPPRQRLVGRLRSRHSHRISNEDPLRVDCGKVAGSNPEAERLAVLAVRWSATIEFHCGVLRPQGTSHPRHRASGECRLVIALTGRGPITKVWRKTDLLNRRMTMAKSDATEHMLRAVDRLGPLIKEHAASAEANRQLSSAVHEAMYQAGLFGMLVPKAR